ncbi:MAG: GtrA family protein, partial [Fibrobacterota bacterium]
MPVSKSGADKSPPLFSFLKDPVLRARILKFGLVGFSGVFINNGILWLLVEFTSLPFYLCSFAAIETSILTNFFLNDNFTWKDRKTGNFFVRLLRYNSSTFFSSIFINMSVLMLFREWAGMQYIIANLIGIGCAMVSNFIMNSFWTYGEFRIDMPKSSRNIIAASLLLRLIIAAGIGAGFDEAYYYAYSLRPSLSYFDHPPAVGFLAGFFPFLTGSAGPFTIRLGTVLLYTLSSFIFYKLAAGMYGRKRAVFSLFLFSFTPMMLLGAGTMVLPDAPMVFFWILSLIFIRRIFFGEEKNINYLMAGLLTGLTFMSKYHGAFLGIFLFLFLLMRRPGKFLSAGPYIYFSASLLAALPVFIWNYRNGFISFLFQGERAGGTNLRPDLFLQAVGGQAGYLTPMVFIQ